MYGIVNLEDIIDATPLDVVTQDIDPHLPTVHIMGWRLSRERKEILELHLLVNDIECSMQLCIIILFLFGITQECYHLFYLLINGTYVMITYSWTWNIIIDCVFLTKLIWIPICWKLWFKSGCYTTNQKTKECRPTQIEIKDNNIQK